MPRRANPVRPRLQPGHTYAFQDVESYKITFASGVEAVLPATSDVLTAVLGAFPGRYDLYSEVARGEAQVEEILGEPYNYTPGWSRVIRK